MNTIKFIVIALLAIFISFRAMNSMMVHPHARIVLASNTCPSALDGKGMCVVYGSVSRSFLMGDVEIRLPDKSLLLVRPDQLKGYSVEDGDTDFLPFGVTFSFFVGCIILVGGMLLALRASAEK